MPAGHIRSARAIKLLPFSPRVEGYTFFARLWRGPLATRPPIPVVAIGARRSLTFRSVSVRTQGFFGEARFAKRRRALPNWRLVSTAIGPRGGLQSHPPSAKR